MRLRDRLYGILLTITLVPLLLCGFIMLYQSNKNAEGIIEENLLGVSESQIDNIENFFEKIKQDMEIVSNYSFVMHPGIVRMRFFSKNRPSFVLLNQWS